MRNAKYTHPAVLTRSSRFSIVATCMFAFDFKTIMYGKIKQWKKTEKTMVKYKTVSYMFILNNNLI